jgi:hypothetical protein
MKTRRDFIQDTLTASAFTALAAPVGALTGQPSFAGRPRMPLYAVLYDRRFADSTRFAAASRNVGSATRAIAGDVTEVWYSELYPRWKEAAVPIAGLTTHGPLFCLERLAWDHDMRVVFRGSHQYGPHGIIEHRLESATHPSTAAQGALSGRDTWPEEIAALIARIPPSPQPLPVNPNAARPVTCMSRCGAPRREPGQLLYSWVIAPRARA